MMGGTEDRSFPCIKKQQIFTELRNRKLENEMHKDKKNQRGNFHKVAIYIMWDEEDEGRARVSLIDHDMTIAGKCLPLHKDLLAFSNYPTENCPLPWDLTGSMKFRCITQLKMKENLSAQKSL
jgi:hypothetical protein